MCSPNPSKDRNSATCVHSCRIAHVITTMTLNATKTNEAELDIR